MAILGLLILAATAVAGVEFIVSNTSDVGFEVFGTQFAAGLDVVFLLGAIAACVAVLGLFLVTGSTERRWGRRRAARHSARHAETEQRLTDVDRTNAELVEENDRLRAELAAQQRAAATMGGVAVPPGVGDVSYGDQVGDAVRSDTIAQTGHYEPYPTEQRPVTTDAERESADKAGVVGRFRGNA